MRLWVGTRDRGRLVEPADATVSVLDHGFTVADGVFETLKVTSAGPFALSRHLRRLGRSAAALGLPAPVEVCWHPKHQVGGDLVNVMPLGPQRFLVLVADVSGHDLKAGFISAFFQGVVRGLVEKQTPIEEVFKRVRLGVHQMELIKLTVVNRMHGSRS